MLNENSLLKELFHENEIKTNRTASIAIFILGIFYITLSAMGKLNLYNLGIQLCSILIIAVGIFDIIVFSIIHLYKFDRPWIKSLIIYSALLSSNVLFFFYPLSVSFNCFGPIILSAMYYDIREIKKTSFLTWLIYAITIWSIVIFEKYSPLIARLHEIQVVTIWKYPKDVLTDLFIPRSVIILIVFLICRGITKRGNAMVYRQAETKAEANSMESELTSASDIQKASLPEKYFETKNKNIVINAFMRPVKSAAGDYYDYFMVNNDIVFLVADVSDKGLPAAMFMMKSKFAIHSAIVDSNSLKEAITKANKDLCLDNKENMFVTLWIAKININTGAGSYVNCGHLFPVIKHADGTVTKLENKPNVMLGVFEKAEIEENYFQLKENETIFVYTDGLTDAENADGVQYGYDNFETSISELSSDELLSEKSIEKIISQIDMFATAKNQFDDMTLLSCSIKNNLNVNTQTFELAATYDSIEKLLDKVNGILKSNFCPENSIQTIDTVIDEICSNIVDYAFEGREGSFKVEFTSGENFIDMTFIDDGPEFDPTALSTPISSQPSNPADIALSGRGIILMRELVDEVRYERRDENFLRVIKLIRN